MTKYKSVKHQIFHNTVYTAETVLLSLIGLGLIALLDFKFSFISVIKCRGLSSIKLTGLHKKHDGPIWLFYPEIMTVLVSEI